MVRNNVAYQQVDSNQSISQVYSAGAAQSKAQASVQHLVFPQRVTRLDMFCKLCIVLALAFGVIQSSRAIVSGVWKLSILMKNQPVIERYHEAMVKERQVLQDRIARYSSPSGIEELARNNLGLVGDNEVLVRIHRSS